MGRLIKIWTDFPDDIPDMETLTAAFEEVFRHKWQEVMVGASFPLSWHLYWEGYLSIGQIRPVTDGTTITSLKADCGENTFFYNITLG